MYLIFLYFIFLLINMRYPILSYPSNSFHTKPTESSSPVIGKLRTSTNPSRGGGNLLLLLLSWTGRAFNEDIGTLELSRASFPTLDKIFGQKIHSTVNKKGRSGAEDRVVLERRGVDTLDIGNGSCRVSRPKEKKRRHPDSRLHMLPTTTLFARGV